MSNQLTDRQFWTQYWESKTDLIFPIKPDYLFHQQLKDLVASGEVKSAIELGGFPGYYSIFLKKYLHLDATLLDYFVHPGILNDLLKANQLSANDVSVIETDLFSYTPEKQYDLVLSCGLIEHFHDTKDILARHVQFMKPDGKLFITLPNFKSVNGWVQKTFDRSNYDKHNIKCMDLQLLSDAASELGLKNVQVTYFGGFSVWLENRKEKSAITKAFIKALWYAGKIPTKILGFESQALSPYIILTATR
ncbi:MAG TPA: class I SAM-dependent methyltransferase [Sphingobacteriaceae bacterium]